jgi:hypothetical protein
VSVVTQPDMNVEEVLTRIEDLAAVVRAFADNSATADEGVTPEALSGAGDVCGMTEERPRDVPKSIPAEALDADIRVG